MPLNRGNYQPRDAAHAVVYRVIDEHLEAFLETARRHGTGPRCPRSWSRRLLKRRGFDPGDGDFFPADHPVEESPALASISSASIQGRIAFGSRAGARVWRVGDDPDAPWMLSTAGARASANGTDDPAAAPVSRHWAWAELLRRAFDIDVLACPRCGGRLRLMATVEDAGAIRAILAAVALVR